MVLILFRNRNQNFFKGTGSTTLTASGELQSEVKFLLQNLAFLLLEAALFPSQRVGLSFLVFFYFCIPFYVGSGSDSGSANANSCGSGFGSATLVTGVCKIFLCKSPNIKKITQFYDQKHILRLS